MSNNLELYHYHILYTRGRVTHLVSWFTWKIPLTQCVFTLYLCVYVCFSCLTSCC